MKIDQKTINLASKIIHLTAVTLLTLSSYYLQADERIEAENYAHFIDTTPGNQGGTLHNDDVDIEVTADDGGGFNIGWIATGERLGYQLELLSGNYSLTSRVASAFGGGEYNVYLNGELINTDKVEYTGGWQQFTTQTIGNVNLTASENTLEIEIKSGDFNLNWLEFSPITGDIYLEAEDYQRAFDTTDGNKGAAYRNQDNVDIEISTDEIGGFNIGWTDTREWLEYDISAAQGSYNLLTRVASEVSTGQYSIFIDDVLIGSQTVTSTGDWQSFVNQQLSEVQLSSGAHVLKIKIDQGDFNLNWITLQYIDPPIDSDNDGVINEIDVCPATLPEATVDEVGCPLITFAPYTRIEAENFNEMIGVSIKKNTYVGSFDSGDHFVFKNVDFGEVSQSLEINVAGTNENTVAEFRLDSIDGPLIASFTMSATSGWKDFEKRRFDLATTSGIHDLYIIGKSGEGIFNLDNFTLSANKITQADNIKVMTLNVYGWATMPQHAEKYAKLVQSRDVDILGIQEGSEDWLISTSFPTDYTRADALGEALGVCWQQRFQIFINVCKGNQFISNHRFDLTDGPNATRTGESAIIDKNGFTYRMMNIHWDHQDDATTLINANETANEVNLDIGIPTILVGDFNSSCNSTEVNTAIKNANMTLIGGARIDCIITKVFSGNAEVFDATPSDHPSVDATLTLKL